MRILFLKAHVKPHTRRLKSGKVIQVGGYETKTPPRSGKKDHRTGDLFGESDKEKGEKREVKLSDRQMDSINDQLRNNEYATDEEMIEFLVEEAKIPKKIASDAVLSYRDQFLTNPLAFLSHDGEKFTLNHHQSKMR